MYSRFLYLCLNFVVLIDWTGGAFASQPASFFEKLANVTDDDINQQFLVHLSEIMSEGSIKVAGGAIRYAEARQDGSIGYKKGLTVYPKDENIRIRVTLHHTLGEPVPHAFHGGRQNTLFGKQKIQTDLVPENRELCAFLDRFRSFEGEIIGGYPDDIMSIDQHHYGKSSFIIVPEHRVKEFLTKNTSYMGNLVSYDPEKTSVHQMVAGIIQEQGSNINLSDFLNGLFRTNIDDSFKLLNFTKQFYASRNLILDAHQTSLLGLIEKVLHPFWVQIAFARDNKQKIYLATDQIEPRVSLVRAILDLIKKDNEKRLSKPVFEALVKWSDSIEDWMMLFLWDIELRQKQKKSIFLSDNFPQFLRHWHDKTITENRVEALPEHDDAQLQLSSTCLFPEMFLREGPFQTIRQVSNIEKFMSDASLGLLTELRETLRYSPAQQHIDGLYLIKLLHGLFESETLEGTDLSRELASSSSSERQKQENYATTKAKIEELLDSGLFSKKIAPHVQPLWEDFVYKDETYQNQGALEFLNSELGTRLRKITFEAAFYKEGEHVTYWDLLLWHPRSKRFFTLTQYEPRYQNVMKRIHAWYMKTFFVNHPKTSNNSEVAARPQQLSSKSLFPSVYNVKWFSQTVCDKLDLHYVHKHLPPSCKNNSLAFLVEEGCFESFRGIIQLAHPALNLERLQDDFDFKCFLESQQCKNWLFVHSIFGRQLSADMISNFLENFEDYRDKKQAYMSRLNEEISKAKQEYDENVAKAKQPAEQLVSGDYYELLEYFLGTHLIVFKAFTGEGHLTHENDFKNREPLDPNMARFVYEKAMDNLDDEWDRLFLKEDFAEQIYSIDPIFSKESQTKAN